MKPDGTAPVADDDAVVGAIRTELGDVLAAAGSRFCVALSGGLDSTVLLHALASLAPGRVRAIYVNHQLQLQASAWGEHCAVLSRRLAVPFAMQAVNVSVAGGEGPEAAARRARYHALSAALQPGEWLLTAHHADDQAETVLLNLCRGSGPAGLGGIPRRATLAAGSVCRPMLGVPRAALLAYASRSGLGWIEDPTNRDLRMDRNFLRHQVLPLLESRWPGLRGTLDRSARLAAEAAGLLDELAAADARRVWKRHRVLLSALAALPEPRQRNVLRYLCRQVVGSVPSEARLRAGLAQLLTAGRDRAPLLAWGGGEIRRFGDALYVMPPLSAWTPIHRDMPCRPGQDLDLGPAGGRVRLVRARGKGLALARLQPTLQVRSRLGGEHLRPAGSLQTRELKKLFQEHGIFPWMRERIPLFYSGAELVAVGDLWVAAAAAARNGEPAMSVRWDRHPPIR